MANHMSASKLKQMCENAVSLGFRPDRLRMLDERLTEFSKTEYTPSIVAKVLRHGQPAFEGAYGIKAPGTAPDSLTADTIFPICSLTKPVIGTLLCLMQEEGLVNLAAPVRTYLPEFTGDEESKVCVWHLLTHTSGILDWELDQKYNTFVKEKLGLTPPEESAPEEEWYEFNVSVRAKMGLAYMEPGPDINRETYHAVVMVIPPSLQPGEAMWYCNTGFGMLGRLIARVSGMSLSEYAKTKLFDPLKMQDTYFKFPQEKRSRYIQRGADFCGSGWLNEHVLGSENGAGGMKSTVSDMVRFGQMCLNKGELDGVRVLSPYSVREMTTNHNSRLDAYSSWGLGWNVRGSKKDDAGMMRSAVSFEHGGFGCVKMLCDPQADVVLAYFTASRHDNYYGAAAFNNMVIGALTD